MNNSEQKATIYMKFEVLTVMWLKIHIFWNLTLPSLGE